MRMQHFFQFAAVTALAVSMSFAQTPSSAPGKTPYAHGMFQHERMMKELNLTPDQQQQAKKIFADSRQKAQPIRQEMRQNREALNAAMKANNTSQIESLSAKQGTLMGKTLAIRTEAKAAFY